MRSMLTFMVCTLGLLGLHTPAQAQALSGAGSSFAAPLYVAVNEKLGAKHQFSMNYTSVGSGEGVKRIMGRAVDFGATDRPLTRNELEINNLLQFPTAIGGVVMTANLPGVNLAQLKLEGPVLADIYMGQISHWNDARIASLNPEQKLPNLAIRVIVREEGSGTAYLFGAYLGRVHTAWKGSGHVVSGASVARGNAGVMQAVQATAGGIGYLEYGYAQDNKLPVLQLRNAFGAFVSPSVDTIAATVRAADWELLFMDTNPTFEINTVNVACPSCWPITGLTYVVAPRRWAEVGKGATFIRFLEAVMNEGDAVAKEENYVPLPSRAKNLVKVTLRSQMQDAKGNRLRVQLKDTEPPRQLLALNH